MKSEITVETFETQNCLKAQVMWLVLKQECKFKKTKNPHIMDLRKYKPIYIY